MILIDLYFGLFLNFVGDTTFNISQVQVLCEYIHLDREERRLFMSNSHEYLITQVQTSLNNPVNLFNNLNLSNL